ncbi:acid phosphatase [Variovorax sp. J31P207]|uniref:acid phosphatase n=1 Tax=Variovorax sp. J31P207 TaxID=3053510 RepID=UPI0025756CC5|nr:acid phosphatase [Variovorax sp. J31P207]MDM0068214.1 acid phosphatase [Variovorax sp. J31P207]
MMNRTSNRERAPLRAKFLRLAPWPASIIAVAVVAACGGGSSGSNFGFLPTSAATPTTSGGVTGSYYRNAKVCIDANNNGRCDSGEASAVTDANGAFKLNGQGALVAEIGTGSKRFDPATGVESAVTDALVFRAPAGANGVVSAISTELAALMDANGGDLAAARTALATRIGVSEAQLLADHNKITDVAVRTALQVEIDQSIERIAEAVAEAGAGGNIAQALRNRFALEQIQNVVVIYAENRGFDNLYGLYPGANGIPGVNPASTGSVEPQKDFDGSVLPALPPVWGGVTASGQTTVITQAQTVGMPNKMFRIDDPAGFFNTGTAVDGTTITRDLVHRFYNNQMQINGGKNDKFAAYSDAGALSMGYFDGSQMKLWKLAQENTLADNFYMGAFGGSFLNHQYLVCACAPVYPNADADSSPAKASISAIDVDAAGNFVRLTPAATSPASVLAGAAVYKNDNTLTPKDASGNFYAVNTMQPPYQPSSNAPAAGDSTKLYADPTKANTLPPQTQTTIGDLLDKKGLSWAWYGGAWNSTTAIAEGDRKFPAAVPPAAQSPNFQFHHQPFNYYASFDPVAHADARAAHLKDFDSDFLKDAAAGKLPAVSFYKPQGNLNQHNGYANIKDGDEHIADLVAKLKASPQWGHMLVVITYDENGGFYDHAAVPKGDRWGPGTRIPALIVSPFSKKGYVDKTPYDTASTLRFITHRWSLPPLQGLLERDAALVKNGAHPMGDLTAALDFGGKS